MIETLLHQPYWILDIFPKQVPAACGGQYFAVERFFRQPAQRAELTERFVRFVLKLSCYEPLRLYHPENETWEESPAPDRLAERLRAVFAGSGSLYLLLPRENALFTLFAGDLYLTLYHPDAALLELARQLARAEGLFLWQPEAQRP